MLTNEDLDRIESEVDKHVKLWPEEVRKLVKMARRYAWLRDESACAAADTPTVFSCAPGWGSRRILEGDDLDAAIDEAIAGERDAK
jgi:hypothetical protein